MGMLHESMRARLVARGAENFRLYADLAASYEERQWSSKGTRNTVRAHARRAGGRDHAVERPVHALHVEGRPGAGRRQHRDPQAGRVVAAVVLAARRPDRRGRVPAGRVQPRPGHRRGGRPAAGRRSAGQADQLHRLAGDRPDHRPCRRREHRAVHRRAGRQGAADRVRRRRPRCRCREGSRPVRRLGSGVPRRHQAPRRGVGARRVPRALPSRRRPPRARRQPRSGDDDRPDDPPRPRRARARASSSELGSTATASCAAGGGSASRCTSSRR